MQRFCIRTGTILSSTVVQIILRILFTLWCRCRCRYMTLQQIETWQTTGQGSRKHWGVYFVIAYLFEIPLCSTTMQPFSRGISINMSWATVQVNFQSRLTHWSRCIAAIGMIRHWISSIQISYSVIYLQLLLHQHVMDCSPDHSQKSGNTLVQVQMQVHDIATIRVGQWDCWEIETNESNLLCRSYIGLIVQFYRTGQLRCNISATAPAPTCHGL